MNDRSDDTMALLLPNTDDATFDAIRERINQLDFASMQPVNDFPHRTLYQAFAMVYESFGLDPIQVLKNPKANEDMLRSVLRADVDRLQRRAQDPNPSIRPTDNYETFGYGFDVMRVGEQIILIGACNDYCAAAGEVPLAQLFQQEYEFFTRLWLFDLVKSPQ